MRYLVNVNDNVVRDIVTVCKRERSDAQLYVNAPSVDDAAEKFAQTFQKNLKHMGDDGVFDFELTIGSKKYKIEASSIHNEVEEIRG